MGWAALGFAAARLAGRAADEELADGAAADFAGRIGGGAKKQPERSAEGPRHSGLSCPPPQ